MNKIIKMLDQNLEYLSHELMNDTLYISIKSNKESLACPVCGKKSSKVHSRYKKSFKDLPIQGKKVVNVIQNRNMFCINPDCDKYTFAETFEFIDSKGKKTKRLIDEIVRVSLTQSSTSAAKYLSEMTVDIKKSSICNYLKKNVKH